MKLRLRVDSRDLHYHIFGQTTDFPLEANFDDPNIPEKVQPPGNVECTCYTVAYAAQNKDKVEYDIDDLFNRVPHSASGADPRQVLGEVVKNGLLIKGTDKRVKPFSSYWRADTGGMDAFDNCRSAMQLAQSPLLVWTNWYDNWMYLGSNAIMPLGQKAVSGHMYAQKGWVGVVQPNIALIQGSPMFVIEWWGGYTMYMPRETFNDAISKLGCGAAILSTMEIDQKRVKTLTEKLKDLIQNLILLLKAQLQTAQQEVNQETPMNEKSQQLYDIGYSHLGSHLTLDQSVPKEYGCAQALSSVLKEAGYDIPEKGISSTVDMNTWLEKTFIEVDKPDVGDVIISVSYTGLPGARGHCGIVGKRSIMSNASDSGTWEAWWSLPAWLSFYKTEKKLVTKYYRAV